MSLNVTATLLEQAEAAATRRTCAGSARTALARNCRLPRPR